MSSVRTAKRLLWLAAVLAHKLREADFWFKEKLSVGSNLIWCVSRQSCWSTSEVWPLFRGWAGGINCCTPLLSPTSAVGISCSPCCNSQQNEWWQKPENIKKRWRMSQLGSIHLHITEHTKSSSFALNLLTLPLTVYEEAQQNCSVQFNILLM